MTNKVDWALKTNNYLVRTVRPDITNKVDWPLKTNNYLVRTVRPDITNKADWPLKTNNYLVRRDECDSRHVHARMDRHQRTRVRTHIGYTIYNPTRTDNKQDLRRRKTALSRSGKRMAGLSLGMTMIILM